MSLDETTTNFEDVVCFNIWMFIESVLRTETLNQRFSSESLFTLSSRTLRLELTWWGYEYWKSATLRIHFQFQRIQTPVHKLIKTYLMLKSVLIQQYQIRIIRSKQLFFNFTVLILADNFKLTVCWNLLSVPWLGQSRPRIKCYRHFELKSSFIKNTSFF